MRAALGDPSAKLSLHPAPTTACRCGVTIPCDGTICGGRLAEGDAGADTPGCEQQPGADAACSNAAAAAAAAMEAMDVDERCARGWAAQSRPQQAFG